MPTFRADPFFLDSRLARPLRTLSIAGALLFAGLLLGLFVPGYLYFLCGTFDRNDIGAHLPSDARTKWDAYNKNLELLQTSLGAVESRISQEVSHGPATELAALMQVRAALQLSIENLKLKPPIRVSAFFLETLTWAWPALYTCFAWLIFLLAPKFPRSRWSRSHVFLFVGVLVLYRWPTWMRNLPGLRTQDRLVYANGNIDVSVGSFFVQEIQAALACLLIIYLWKLWADFPPYWRAQIGECWPDIVSGKQMAIFQESMVVLFIHWQVSSVVLAAAFLPFTFYFWNYVIDYGQQRYLPHALITHGLWGVTWLLMTLPLAWTWYAWSFRYKLAVQAQAYQLASDEHKEESLFRGAIEPPISSLNVIGSLTGALAMFGFPLLKEIFTHI
jgi:hypothetical protein